MLYSSVCPHLTQETIISDPITTGPGPYATVTVKGHDTVTIRSLWLRKRPLTRWNSEPFNSSKPPFLLRNPHPDSILTQTRQLTAIMDFPFGHHHDRHHRSEEDPNPNPRPYPPPADNPYGYQPPPPPAQPYYGGGPPPVQHVSHEYGRPEYAPHPAPAQPYYGGGPPPVQHVSHEYGRPEYAPSPPQPHVQHLGHEVGPGGQHGHVHGHGYENQEPHRPGFFPQPQTAHVEQVSHGNRLGELTRQPTVRIFCKAAENYSLSIREGSVVLVPENPRDEHQHWHKDLKYSTRVKDEEGLPSFALVNKATGQAIKHAIGAHNPVRLVPYKPDYLDESVLWTESKDTGENFRCIRMVNNIALNFDALHGDEDHGGVRNGTLVHLYEWLKGKNQRWKIVPY